MLPHNIEKQLLDMGIMPATELEHLSAVADTRWEYAVKGYYRDPRDENTAEVPF